MFGGNFLHSFGILKQLKIAKVEDTTKVPQKFRYPFFTEMLWYVLAKYVHTLLGRSHLDGEVDREHELTEQPHVHLTHYELFGLKEIVMYLYDLPPQRKNVPELIRDPVQLIKDVRSLVERHCRDSPELAITGKPVLHPDLNQQINNIASNQQRSTSDDNNSTADNSSHFEQKYNIDADMENNDETKSFASPKALPSNNKSNSTKTGSSKKNSIDNNVGGNERSNGNSSSAPRRRRRRCKVCVPCNSTECGHCAFCLDMVIEVKKIHLNFEKKTNFFHENCFFHCLDQIWWTWKS